MMRAIVYHGPGDLRPEEYPTPSIGPDEALLRVFAAFGLTIDGAFAKYMRITATAILQGNLIPISETTDPAAVALIEPFACVPRGQDAEDRTSLKIVLGGKETIAVSGIEASREGCLPG
jgi:threonine dehydrogenase-like Zn-dependent dehydrogenase